MIHWLEAVVITDSTIRLEDIKMNKTELRMMIREELKKMTDEEMRDGLPPKSPGRDKKANSYFNTAKSHNIAQANKKYTAETKKKR